jgi:hypothetical protein
MKLRYGDPQSLFVNPSLTALFASHHVSNHIAFYLFFGTLRKVGVVNHKVVFLLRFGGCPVLYK